MFNSKGNTMKVLFLLIAVCFIFTGCKFIQVNPSTDQTLYESLGGNVGAYLKVKEPDLVAKSAPWVKGAMAMTDEELVSKNVLLAMYKLALETRPDDAEFILLVKSIVDLMGLQIRLDASLLFPEQIPKYLMCTRALLKGYSEATK